MSNPLVGAIIFAGFMGGLYVLLRVFLLRDRLRQWWGSRKCRLGEPDPSIPAGRAPTRRAYSPHSPTNPHLVYNAGDDDRTI